MSEQPTVISAKDVQPGQKIRTPDGTELLVTRVEMPFLDREDMVAFIEDTDERWFKRPVPLDAAVEVLPQVRL